MPKGKQKRRGRALNQGIPLQDIQSGERDGVEEDLKTTIKEQSYVVIEDVEKAAGAKGGGGRVGVWKQNGERFIKSPRIRLWKDGQRKEAIQIEWAPEIIKIGKNKKKKKQGRNCKITLEGFKNEVKADCRTENVDINELQHQFRGLDIGLRYTLFFTHPLGHEKGWMSVNFYTSPTTAEDITLSDLNVLTWSKALGARSYEVQIECEGGQTKVGNADEQSFSLENEEMICGESCHIRVVAIGHHDGQRTEGERKLIRIGGSLVPGNVLLTKSPIDDSRSLVAVWESPEQDGVKFYDVEIHEVGGEWKKLEESDQFRHTFSKLRADQEYICKVRARFDKLDSEFSISKHAKTGPVSRSKTDIATLGKVRNVKWNKDDEAETCASYSLTWDPCDIGVEAVNFSAETPKVFFYAHEDSGPIKVEPNKNKPNSVKVEFGKKYEARIVSNFVDLDSRESVKAEVVDFHTVMEKPQNIMVDSRKGVVHVSWKQIPGAIKYRLDVFDKEENTCHKKIDIVTTQHSYKVGHDCRNGNKYTFQITAFGTGDVETKGKSTVDTLGGAYCPRRVQAKTQSLRSINIGWSEPKYGISELETYHCRLIEQDSGTQVNESDTKNCTVTFDNLKMKVSYIAQVWASFRGGTDSEKCHSNLCLTDSASRDVNFEIEDAGKATNLRGSLEYDKTKVECLLLWSVPLSGKRTDHFIWIRTEVLMKCDNDIIVEEKLDKFETTQHPVHDLKRGQKFAVSVTYVYKDLDDESEKRAECTEEIITEIEKPEIARFDSEGDHIVIGWEKVEGAKYYAIASQPQEGQVETGDKVTTLSHTMNIGGKYGYGQIIPFKLTAFPRYGKEKESEWRREIIGGTKVPYDVTATSDNNDPRGFNITWCKPQSGATKYHVTLCRKNELSVRATEQVTETSHKFTDLASNLSYYCTVQAVSVPGEKAGKISISNKIMIPKIKRREFNIAEEGKVKALSLAKISYSDKGIAFRATWKPATLGDESMNFKLERISVNIEGGKKHHSEKETLDFLQHWGKQCVFEAVAHYMDLDTHISTEAVCERTLVAEIQKPSGIQVSNSEQRVIVEWKRAMGAEKYKVVVRRCNDNKEVCMLERIGSGKCTFPTGESFRYGEEYLFEVTAMADGVDNQEHRSRHFIGGDQCPRQVVMEHASDSIRSLLVHWNPPKFNEKGILYRAQIYENPNEQAIMEDVTEKTIVQFHQLKMGASYFACVRAERDGNHSEFAHSATYKTDKVSRNSSSQIDIIGRVRDVEFKPEVVSSILMNFEISWRQPSDKNIALHYDFTKSESWVTDEYERTKLGKHMATDRKLTVKLERGKKYKVHIVNTYKDLDTGLPHEAICELDLSPEIDIPHIVSILPHDGNIKVSWTSVPGAKCYKLSVKDKGGRTILSPQKTESVEYAYRMDENNGYGKIWSYMLTAIGHNGVEQQSKPCVQTIGGDLVPTGVNASCKKYRCIEVTWTGAKTKCNSYSVILFELGKDAPVRKMPVEGQCTAIFQNLKSDTEYRVAVMTRAADVAPMLCYSGIVRSKKKTRAGTTALSRLKTFGCVDYMPVTICKQSSTAKVEWKPPNLGQDCMVVKYVVQAIRIDEKGRETVIFNNVERTKEDASEVEVKEVQSDAKYRVTVKTYYEEIDTEISASADNEICFHARISRPQIPSIVWNVGEFVMSWEKVYGADTYDVKLQCDMEDPRVERGTATSLFVQYDDRLRIGRTCRIKLVANGEENTVSSETDWMEFVIGGKFVPREVGVQKPGVNPRRSIEVTFKPPIIEKHLKDYKVTAKPDVGIEKHATTKDTHYVFEYLRSGTKYKLLVQARYEYKNENEYLASESESLKTHHKTSNNRREGPVSNIEGTHGVTNITYGSITTLHSEQTAADKDQGKVEDLRHLLEDLGDSQDRVILAWKPPSFSNSPEDFKVEYYEITIGGIPHPKVNFEKDRKEYESKFNLNVGKTYEFSIKTYYWDIDKDTREPSVSKPVEMSLKTRPSKPELKRTKEDGKLEVEWNASMGAIGYLVEIFAIDAEKPEFAKKTDETYYSHEFTHDFGIGSQYRVHLTAFGSEEGNNNHKTVSDWIIIGGDRVPRRLCAKSSLEEPKRKIVLEWKPPKVAPDYYTAEVIPKRKSEKEITFQKDFRTGIVSGLSPGMKYIFILFAHHNGERSAGTRCKEISTEPAPAKVQNIAVKKCPVDPYSKVEITWSEAADTGNFESYRLIIYCDVLYERRELSTTTNKYTANDLQPGVTYEITLTGSRDGEFGEESDRHQITTVPEEPSYTFLKYVDAKNLELKFAPVRGQVAQYEVVLFRENTLVEIGKTEENNFRFTKFEPHSVYHATVTSVYKNGEKSKPAKSSAVTTPPDVPEIENVNPVEFEKEPCQRIEVTWKENLGCHTHEVEFVCNDKIENTITVKNENKCIYHRLSNHRHYTVRVRSKNTSELFGEWTKHFSLPFVPPRLRNVKAVSTKNRKIRVSWEKPAHSDTPFRIMPVFVQFEEENIVEMLEDEAKPIDVNSDSCYYDFSLLPCRDYFFHVWACGQGNVAGAKERTQIVPTDPGKCSIKKCLKDDESPHQKIDVEWEKVPRCSSYEVSISLPASPLVSSSSDSDFLERLLTTKETKMKHVCLYSGVLYTVKVRAYYKEVKGEWSEPSRVHLVPEQVSNLKTEISECKIQLTWDELPVPPENYIVKLYEKLFISDESDSFAVGNTRTVKPSKESQSRAMFGTKPGRLYYCEVVAKNEAGEGSAAQTLAVKSKSWGIAKGLVVQHNKESPHKAVTLTWQRPEGVESFSLDIKGNCDYHQQFPIDEPTYQFENGIPGSTYIATVYCGSESTFDKRGVSTCFTLAPTQPRTVRTARSPNNPADVLIEFDEPKNIPDVYEITPIALSRKQEHQKFICNSPMKIISGLILGETYTFKITSISNNLDIEYKHVSSIETDPFVLGTEKVRDLKAVPCGSDCVQLSWSHAKFPIDEYEIHWKCNGGEHGIEKVHDNKITMSNLKFGRIYKFEVSARNSVGTGTPSSDVQFETGPLPTHNLVANTTDEGNSLAVTFDHKNERPVSFRVTAEPRSSKKKVTKETNQCHCILKLDFGESYDIHATVIRNEMESDRRYLDRTIQLPPAPLKNFRVTMTEDVILYEWEQPQKLPERYRLRLRTNDKEESLEVKEERYMIKYPLPACIYKLRAAAWNNAGPGDETEWKEFITKPLPPSRVEFEPRSSSMDVRIVDEPCDLKQYEITILKDDRKIDSKQTRDLKVTFEGLQSGQQYAIHVVTHFCGEKSEPLIL